MSYLMLLLKTIKVGLLQIVKDHKHVAIFYCVTCHGHDKSHVKIRTRDLLCYNRVLCANQHVEYTII